MLSVLAVLIGLLGMHALAPGGAGHAEHIRSGHGAVALGVMDDGPGGDGHCGGGRLHHADPTCASGAVSDGPQLPAPGLAATDAAVPSVVPRPCAVAAPDGARAPPSLAELQLLRI
ncbi:DUF6153 family protein [Streptomyces sp. NPDC014636]|uniref:DUF6153 family protein n=1 Tax=Streptomyces sp. NPDC014636 TaxID=3364876 RepID=UPI0036FA5555